MTALPRAIQNFRDRTVAYYLRRRLSVLSLGPNDDVYAVIDAATVTARRYGYTKSYTVDAATLGVSERRLISPIESIVLRELGRGLRSEHHVVEPSENPHYRVEVTVHVTGSVYAWPDTPGVTTPPWRAVGPEILVPWSIYDDAWGELRRVQMKAEYDNVWEFSVLCNPQEWAVIDGRDLVGNLCRVIADERVPYGFLRPVERV
jgi:hypothetical protein